VVRAIRLPPAASLCEAKRGGADSNEAKIAPFKNFLAAAALQNSKNSAGLNPGKSAIFTGQDKNFFILGFLPSTDLLRKSIRGGQARERTLTGLANFSATKNSPNTKEAERKGLSDLKPACPPFLLSQESRGDK
jgi:hypothetical protein